MENVRTNNFVPIIRALWVEQKNRELLYLEALKKDSMGSFRRLLSQGHVSAVLFQKEIRSIYDYFKCFLTDKELSETNQIASLASLQLLENAKAPSEVAACLRKLEGTTLQHYKALRTYMDRELEACRILDEHLNRIAEFYEVLGKLEGNSRKTIAYTAAA
ncbi:hypothetical protein [Dyadobacter sp. CY343]|uniref:hypothetical protein n=1 Tax=Dyadobacter sp. CY343 TaxID=2907299 RepID=UPI001F1CB722|nr:hypothetical protein [Dyadobacter sp. CY343]MCE7060959.1 hypothetical protein [Dyadobacter sp. CY343]